MKESLTTSLARNVTTRMDSPGAELRWKGTAKTIPIWSHATASLHWLVEHPNATLTKEIHGAWKVDLSSAFIRAAFPDHLFTFLLLLTAEQCLVLSIMDGLKEQLKSLLLLEDARFTAKIMQTGFAESISAAITEWHLMETESGLMGWTQHPQLTPHGWLAPPIPVVGSSTLTEMLVISIDSGSTSTTNQETAGTERINYLLKRGF